MEKAVGYIRVSSEEQARVDVSLAAQEEKILAYCSQECLEPLKVIRDEEVTAINTLAERAGGRDLLDLLESNLAKHVVALKMDRLFMDAAEFLKQTMAWENYGVALHLVDMRGTTINTATAKGKFFLTSMEEFVELKSNLISESTKTAMAKMKAQLKAYGGTPYGYDRVGDELKKNPFEYKTLEDIHKWWAEGWSLGEISRELTRRKSPTKKGGTWWPGTVKYLLENTIYEELRNLIKNRKTLRASIRRRK